MLLLKSTNPHDFRLNSHNPHFPVSGSLASSLTEKRCCINGGNFTAKDFTLESDESGNLGHKLTSQKHSCNFPATSCPASLSELSRSSYSLLNTSFQSSIVSSSSSMSSPISSQVLFGSSFRRSVHVSLPFGGFFANLRGFRKSRRRQAAKKHAKEKELELDVKICIEEEPPDDPEVLYKPEEITGIMNDFETPDSLAPTGLFLGGAKYIVIQGEPGAVIRGKKDSGGVTIKKTNIALIVGIYDEPMTPGQCNRIVERLGDYLLEQGAVTKETRKPGNLRFYSPKFKYIFCDMDGTLLNSKSLVTKTTAEALKEATSRGVNIVIATGKTRPAVIHALTMVGLAGKNGIVSESSPGIFLQGLLVYGLQGKEIARRNLDQNVCREAFLYSLENEVPVIAFSQDRCFSLFDHPLVDSLHTIYHEPKAEIIPSIDQLLSAGEIQKLIFPDTAEGISTVIRPHWEEAIEGRASVVQALPDMLEIVPLGTCKGNGVKILLDHLGISPKEVMAIGDGENDVQMLELVSLGVALKNGTEKTKAAADVIGASNDEDGVAQAIYQYAF